jgi:hypothetical protein
MAAMAPPDRHEDKWAALFRPPAAEHTTGVTEEDKTAEDTTKDVHVDHTTGVTKDVEQKHKKPPVWQYLTAVAAVFAVALLFVYNSMPTDQPQVTDPPTMPAENEVADEPPPDTRLKLDPDVRQAVITQLTKAGGQPSRPVINFNFASDPSTGKAADVLSTANWMAGVRARTPPPEPPVH